MKKIVKGITLVGIGYLTGQIVGNSNRLKMIQDMVDFLVIEKMAEMNMDHMDLGSVRFDIDTEVVDDEAIGKSVDDMLQDLEDEMNVYAREHGLKPMDFASKRKLGDKEK